MMVQEPQDNPNSLECFPLACYWQEMPVGSGLDVVFSLVGGHRSNKGHSFEIEWVSLLTLPPNNVSISHEDLSGTIGLLSGPTAPRPSRRDDDFERFVADSIVSAITALLLKQKEEKNIRFLISGPCFPKLRGRLAYRTPRPQIDLFFWIQDQAWIKVLTADQINLDETSAGSKETLEFLGPFPALGQDAFLRFYIRPTSSHRKGELLEIFQQFEKRRWSAHAGETEYRKQVTTIVADSDERSMFLEAEEKGKNLVQDAKHILDLERKLKLSFEKTKDRQKTSSSEEEEPIPRNADQKKIIELGKKIIKIVDETNYTNLTRAKAAKDILKVIHENFSKILQSHLDNSEIRKNLLKLTELLSA